MTKNKDHKEYTKKVERELTQQVVKLENWVAGKNLDTLYPSILHVTVAEDVEGVGDRSFDLHDHEHDFDLSNNLKHEIIQNKKGDITKVEIKGNQVKLSLSGPKFSFELLTDGFFIKKTQEHSDLRFSAYLKATNI